MTIDDELASTWTEERERIKEAHVQLDDDARNLFIYFDKRRDNYQWWSIVNMRRRERESREARGQPYYDTICVHLLLKKKIWNQEQKSIEHDDPNEMRDLNKKKMQTRLLRIIFIRIV